MFITWLPPINDLLLSQNFAIVYLLLLCLHLIWNQIPSSLSATLFHSDCVSHSWITHKLFDRSLFHLDADSFIDLFIYIQWACLRVWPAKSWLWRHIHIFCFLLNSGMFLWYKSSWIMHLIILRLIWIHFCLLSNN